MSHVYPTTLFAQPTAGTCDDAALVGIPFDLGGKRRGPSLGPRAIRFAGLVERLVHLGIRVHDMGDLAVPDAPVASPWALNNLPAVQEMARMGYEAARQAMTTAQLAIFLGGDHSVSMGTLAGVSSWMREQGQHLGLIWFDAHGDFQTPQTTPTGHMHGMPFATSLGLGLKDLTHLGGFAPKVAPERAVLIGARDIDPDEQIRLEQTGITIFPMEAVEERGIRRVVDEALAIASRGAGGVHVSFDLDVLDPREAPGTGSPASEGMAFREARRALRMIGQSGLLRSIDLVEVDPLLDHRNETARIAVELLACACIR